MNIFRRPNFKAKSLKVHRKSGFNQTSGSELRNFRARENAIKYRQLFHTPTRLPPKNASQFPKESQKREGFNASFKPTPAVREDARQLRDNKMSHSTIGLATSRFLFSPTAFGQYLMPDIPQSEIAATRFFTRAQVWEKNWAKNRVKYWANISGYFRASFAVQSDPPKFLPKLSLYVLSGVLCLKSQNFISASFWGLGRPTVPKHWLV